MTPDTPMKEETMTEPQDEHPDSVIAAHEIGPFLRSLTRSGETLHEADIRGIETAVASARADALREAADRLRALATTLATGTIALPTAAVLSILDEAERDPR